AAHLRAGDRQPRFALRDVSFEPGAAGEVHRERLARAAPAEGRGREAGLLDGELVRARGVELQLEAALAVALRLARALDSGGDREVERLVVVGKRARGE